MEEINKELNEQIPDPEMSGQAQDAALESVQPQEGETSAAETSHEINVEKASKRQKIGKIFAYIGLYAFLTVMALVVLFPFYWMLISSVKTIAEYNLYSPTLWPKKFEWVNYANVFSKEAATIDLGTMFGNTVLVGVVSTILSLIVTVLSAYAFAKMEFRGKNILFGAMLATMMIPGELFTITNYITVTDMGMYNKYTALILPFLVSVFYIYLLRQNFLQIPNELYLAAKVDGTSDFKYLWRVMIPLASPTLISITILKMMGAWNSYLWPRLVADDGHQLITVGLRELADALSEGSTPNFPLQMAAVVLVTLPLLVVFLLFRKYIMRGVSRSGIKG